MRLQGRTALVTGSSSGLGRAIALRFAREGAHVVLCDLQDGPRPGEPDVTPTAELIRAEGGSARFTAADVRDVSAVDALVRDAVSDTGRLDIVVNNAGLFGGSAAAETSDEEWEGMLALNLTSQFLVSRAAVRVMLDQEPLTEVRGRIVNMASQLGITAPPGKLVYSVAKAGVAQLTRQLAVDYGRHGVIVNAIAPGRIITGTSPGEPEYLADGTVNDATAYSLSRTPFSRLGRPEDIAGAALFLSSDDCTFVSGHVLAVDGGWLAY
ncbi:MAG TPA: SDR family NAD(P)-dependent oxidoreductase [Gryllotalpicola sp.]